MKSIINAGKNKHLRDIKTELYLTPEFIIEDIVKNILKLYPELKEKVWVDPFADKGQWAEVFKKYDLKHKSYDIRSTNENVEQKDFFDLNIEKDMFIIGNPPFSLIKKITNRLIENNAQFFLLGGSYIWTHSLSRFLTNLFVFQGFEGLQKDKRSKISFIDSNNNSVNVWCVGALHLNNKDNVDIDFSNKEIAISPFMSIEDNSKIIKLFKK